MELWLVFALATAFLSAANAWLDRVVMRDLRDPLIVSVLHCTVVVLPLTAYALLVGSHWPSMDQWGWVLLRGVLWAAFSYFILKGAELGDLTIYGVLSRLRVAFTLVLAALFLGEPLTLAKIGAFALVVAGALVATSIKGTALKKSLREPAVWHFAVSAFLFAVVSVMDKFLVNQYDAVTYVIGYNAIAAILTLVFLTHRVARLKKALYAKPKAFLLRAFILPSAFVTGFLMYQGAQAGTVGLVVELSFPLTLLAGFVLLRERDNLKRRALGSLLVLIASVLAVLG